MPVESGVGAACGAVGGGDSSGGQLIARSSALGREVRVALHNGCPLPTPKETLRNQVLTVSDRPTTAADLSVKAN